MEEPIPATCLNDFIFCPASIYFHRMFDDKNDLTIQKKDLNVNIISYFFSKKFLLVRCHSTIPIKDCIWTGNPLWGSC